MIAGLILFLLLIAIYSISPKANGYNIDNYTWTREQEESIVILLSYYDIEYVVDWCVINYNWTEEEANNIILFIKNR